MSITLHLAASAALIVGIASVLPGCGQVGELIAPALGPPQAACEPLTGLSYDVRLDRNKARAGTVVLAVAPHPGCQLAAARAAAVAQKIQGKALYIIRTCQVLAVGWDPAKQQGGAIATDEVMPGCTPA